ncbi:MAG TPA: ABC transporter permease [Verrucomicrobiae bacterium]|nr:ABC transporter permease [Verrucomicrobiae bacterium]
MPAQETTITRVPVFKIRPSRGLPRLNLRELWEYRELLYILMWRDIKVRYKQTALGVAWTVLQPFVAMVVFTIFLGKLAKVPSDGIPYPVFAYTGLVLWQFFAKALTEASTSLVVNERVITKVYFPRLLVPSGVVLAGLLDFAIAFLLLAGLMAVYGISVSPKILLAPCFLLLTLVASLGVSFWLSALDVKFRDVRYTLAFLTQIWLFATPVVYPGSLVPEQFRVWYGLNPMVGVIEGFRWSLLGKSPAPDAGMLASSIVVIALIFLGGLTYFRSMERTLADVI